MAMNIGAYTAASAANATFSVSRCPGVPLAASPVLPVLGRPGAGAASGPHARLSTTSSPIAAAILFRNLISLFLLSPCRLARRLPAARGQVAIDFFHRGIVVNLLDRHRCHAVDLGS